MKEENITSITVDPDNLPRGKTEWERVRSMTEGEINAAALSDPDAQPATREELDRFRRVVDVQDIRKQLNLSQREFADAYHLSVRTLQEWEQGRIRADITATAFLKAIANDPDGVRKALEQKKA